MTGRPKILDILRRCPDSAADDALAAGATRVAPEYQRELIELLLERGSEVGLSALPVIFDQVRAENQMLIVSEAAALSSSLRANIRESRGQTRLNTLEIIRRSGGLQHAYLVAHALHDGSEKVRTEAAQVLRYLTEKYWENHDETQRLLQEASEEDEEVARAVVQTLKLLREERMHLTTAVRDALNTYESHHRSEIVEAAMAFADELEDTLFQQSTRKLGKLTHAMQEVFSITLAPRMAPFVYIALGYPEMRKRIIPILTECRDGVFFAEFIRYHWLARDPLIRRNLLTIRDLAWLGDGLEAAFSLPQEIAALAPSWLMSLGLSSDRKVSLLLCFMLLDNPPVYRAALWALTRINTPVSTLALQGVLDNEEPSLAEVARRELDHRRRLERRLGQRPRSDRPEAWSGLLDHAGLSEDFDDLWHNYDRLHPVQAKSAGHFALKFVSGFMTQMQIRLLSPQAPDRIRALRLLLVLHVAGSFQKEVFAAANDPVPEVRAVAMSCLSNVGEATSRRILERAINDDEPLVQAAAIDALDRLGTKQRPDLFLTKTEHEEPRVRAAAVRALLRMQVPTGATALIQMLRDPRPDHRCGALWIADQMRLTALAPRIRELEKSDADPRISRIALHVLRRLDRLTRAAAPSAPERSLPATPAGPKDTRSTVKIGAPSTARGVDP